MIYWKNSNPTKNCSLVKLMVKTYKTSEFMRRINSHVNFRLYFLSIPENAKITSIAA